LPEVEKKTTSDGRKIVLSKSGNDHAIGGESSGAVCAFTAAWERPDAFSRVYSCIGTYVGLRGANEYPTLVRKYEPKPLRVFQQDGSNDLNIYAGDWWMVNQEMERALTFAGYEHDHIWGDNGHNGKHSAAIFPDAMRFLWKGWPEPVKAGATKNKMVTDIFSPEEGWQEDRKEVPGAAPIPKSGTQVQIPMDGLYVNAKGEVTFCSTEWGLSKQATAPDGGSYRLVPDSETLSIHDAAGKVKAQVKQLQGSDIVVLNNGNAYVTEPLPRPLQKSGKPTPGLTSHVRLIKPDGTSEVVDDRAICASGVTASPDQSLLYVADANSHWVYCYQIQPDGKLTAGQRYNWLHVPDSADDSGARGMCVDRDGRLYVATRLGIQICDQTGRVNSIIPVPSGQVTGVAFGGPDFDTLYAACGDKVYKRKTKVKGANAFEAPIKPKIPGL
jgi:sugar lactone lactonase YvrE